MGSVNDRKGEMQSVQVDEQEARILKAFRDCRSRKHGEMEVAVKNGATVKLWVTDKWDLNEGVGTLMEINEGRAS